MPIVHGTKNRTEAMDCNRVLLRWYVSVLLTCEGGPVRAAGGNGNEDAVMSSDKHGEIPCRRKSKVS